MLEKKVFAKNHQQTKTEVGQKIYELRCTHNMSITLLSHNAIVPPIVIERWELGKGYLDLYYLERIAAAFNKRISIRFEDLEK